ncbi:MAG TPA: ParM/StbA family protein [Roseiflexaceae bacterium]|nr:ParM/StbA family protein [Roseiflexaceae bacterium]
MADRASVLGGDLGNSTAVVVAGNRREPRVHFMPSFVGSGSLDDLERLRSGGGGSSKLEEDEYALGFREASWFVGRLALEQSRDATSGRDDVTRYWSGHTLRLLLTQIGALFKPARVTTRIVTCLPIQVFTKANRRAVQEALIGTHSFALNGREREVTIERVVVLMEGAAALGAYGKADPVPQYVLDCGGRTTDLYRTIGMKPDRKGSAGTTVGVELIGDELDQWFLRTHGRNLSRQEISDILAAYAQRKPLPTVYARGKKVELGERLAAIVEAIGARLESEVNKTWRTADTGGVAGDAATALMIGGGAYFFGDRIKKLIPFLEIPERPELANAQGCKALGDQLDDAEWDALGLPGTER